MMARINLYAEEISDRVEIVSKTTPDGTFTGLRIYLELPVTVETCRLCGALKGAPNLLDCRIPGNRGDHVWQSHQVSGPFMHHPGDDDSSAVTFWGKRDLREVLQKALALLDFHYDQRLHVTVEIPKTALVEASGGLTSALEIIARKMDTFKKELAEIEVERAGAGHDKDHARGREISCRAALGALAMVHDEIRGVVRK